MIHDCVHALMASRTAGGSLTSPIMSVVMIVEWMWGGAEAQGDGTAMMLNGAASAGGRESEWGTRGGREEVTEGSG